MVRALEDGDSFADSDVVVHKRAVASLDAASRGHEFEAVFQVLACDLVGKVNRLAPGHAMVATAMHNKAKLFVRFVRRHEVVKTQNVTRHTIDQKRRIATPAIIAILQQFDRRPRLAIVVAPAKDNVDGAMTHQICPTFSTRVARCY